MLFKVLPSNDPKRNVITLIFGALMSRNAVNAESSNRPSAPIGAEHDTAETLLCLALLSNQFVAVHMCFVSRYQSETRGSVNARWGEPLIARPKTWLENCLVGQIYEIWGENLYV